MASVPQPPPAGPVARLRLAPHSAVPRRIDGAWWPRSRNLLVELPLLIGALPRDWGQINGVTVNAEMWSASPGRILVANHVVRLRREPVSRDRHTVCLLSPARGRWDLLVVPPEVDAADAEYLMAAVATDTH
ncbi:DUF5994 family protein [Streptomyces olivochromogenes]|uniref:Uncharacterized protein n=1 Tax=Streptomyces olivochromogenes TaxID=1963 RepID=A0A250VQ02_STROL|nr:DUF5994 family protein [Streptomyces olivochromogenes]KUN39712.1 hypothetical protein AQJ27_42140 [Streptomyces olivochromogenes]GAX56159.1 hypothetical protein SO3561_07726 [Streptomyces olivochromogenes]